MTTNHTIAVTVALLIATLGLVSAPVGAQETGNQSNSNVTQTVDELKSDLDRALQLYKQGEKQKALDIVHNSHHENWEEPGYDAELSRIDPALVGKLEMNTHEKLPSQIENNASVEKVENTTRTVQSQLDEAAVALTQKSESESGSSESESGVSERVTAIKSDLDRVVELYDEGNSSAAKQVISDTYYENFEVIEGRLIEQDPEMVEEMEAAFNEELPSLIDENASVEEVESKVSEMKSTLDEAEKILLESESGKSVSEFVENENGSSSDTETPNSGTTSSDSNTGGADSSGDSSSESGTNANSLPGFGAVVSLLALVSVAVLARRRRR